MMADIQFIDDVTSFEPKRKQQNMLFAPVSPQAVRDDDDVRVQLDGPPLEAFRGPLPPPPNTTVLSSAQPIYTIQEPIKHHPGFNCIDVSNHITACPVCSKLHRSYSNVYIGIIISLIILCFFLGRKFFE